MILMEGIVILYKTLLLFNDMKIIVQVFLFISVCCVTYGKGYQKDNDAGLFWHVKTGFIYGDLALYRRVEVRSSHNIPEIIRGTFRAQHIGLQVGNKFFLKGELYES